MREEEEAPLEPDEIYYVLQPHLNEIQDKLYSALVFGAFNGKFWEICKHLNITEEEGENIMEEIKNIQYTNFPDL